MFFISDEVVVYTCYVTSHKLIFAKFSTGLPHTQGTQGIQGISGNFQVEENLRETQGDSGNLMEF